MATYVVIYDVQGTLNSAVEYGHSAHDAAQRVVSQYGADRVVMVSEDAVGDRSQRCPLAAMEGKR